MAPRLKEPVLEIVVTSRRATREEVRLAQASGRITGAATGIERSFAAIARERNRVVRFDGSTTRFNGEVRRFPATAKRSLLATQRRIATAALVRVVGRTPVDTGRARGGWQVGVDSAPRGEPGRLDKSGRATIAAGRSTINSLRELADVHVTNNVPYIVYLENGSSQQAPRGMVRLALIELARAGGEPGRFSP